MENYNLESARELINSAEKELSKEFEKAEEICEFNSEKVLKAFQENRVNEADFGVLQVMVMEILEEKK